MKQIETGVDKLVDIIIRKKKVTVAEVAKELGVSRVLVQEWVDFLEEDGIISVDYSLSKVWLSEKKLSKKDVLKKEKEYNNKKDVFVRKVETTLKSLEKETLGFERMKDEFDDLKKEIGGEIDYVKKELDELEYYEKLKNSIDKDIQKQKAEYKKLMEESHLQIKVEERRFQELIAHVDREQKKIIREEKNVKSLEDQENLISQKILEMNNLLDKVRIKLKEEKQDVRTSEINIEKLESLTEQIGHRIKTKKHKSILPLIKLSEEHNVRVVNLQEEILEKLKKKKSELLSYGGQKKDVYNNLKSFFDKKSKADFLLKKIDADKSALQKDYDSLIKKAQVFNVFAKDSSVNKLLAELTKQFDSIETKRISLKNKILDLSKLIRG